MLGAIIPKDISICSVIEEIARQIDHFTREPVDLPVFSVADLSMYRGADAENGSALARIPYTARPGGEHTEAAREMRLCSQTARRVQP